MDGVFLFEDVAVEDSKTMQGYDAIVVEQWTVLKVCVQFFFFDFFFFFGKSRHTKTARQTLTYWSVLQQYQTGNWGKGMQRNSYSI